MEMESVSYKIKCGADNSDISSYYLYHRSNSVWDFLENSVWSFTGSVIKDSLHIYLDDLIRNEKR